MVHSFASRLLAALSLLVPISAFAFQPHRHGGVELPEGLVVEAGPAVRSQPNVEWRALETLPSLRGLMQRIGPRWQVLWDRDRRVPSRIMGAGLELPGTIESAEKAELEVRKLLAEHLSALAPGARISDFELVTNQLSHGLRTLGFEQRAGGLPVRGGQLSVRIKNDRLFVFASEAIPHVDVLAPAIREDVAVEAASALLERRYRTRGQLREVDGPLVLPLIREGSVETRSVFEVILDTQTPVGRWSVFIDAQSGLPVAFEQTLRFASGTLRYNAPERRPGATRVDMLARWADVFVNGAPVRTSTGGTVTWDGEEPAELRVRAVGPYVRVINAAGSPAEATLSLAPGGEAVWNASANENADAQVITFVASELVKDRARLIAPNMSYLAAQLEATVNMNDSCNAYSDGVTINFFAASNQCENTGRLPDVVFHEFGHSFHYNALLRGVGRFDTALSEGASDYLAATITNDSGMGRGFFRSDRPLRELDPIGTENMWPRDVGEPHQTGIIFGGAMWDLRKTFVTKMGAAAGVEYTDRLWYQTLQRAADIPSTFVEILAADDDDGDLSNGSPNFCDINHAFALHGLADPTASGLLFGPVQVDGAALSVGVEGTARCPGSAAAGAYLVYRARSAPAQETRVPLTLTASGFEGALPVLADGEVLEYRVQIELESGDERSLPHNPADPWYQRYYGPVTPIYCTNFDTDPWAEGWTHALVSGSQREGADDWQWGPPLGKVGSGDPGYAFTGDYVIGNDLGIGENWDGRYQGRKVNQAVTPPINVAGYEKVRLQYRRWLTVEDGESDQASILANDIPVWSNFVGAELGPTHHEDREWRFHDVDLTSEIVADQLQITFRLTSDRSLAFGGWNIDDFCLVGTKTETRVAACGDGVLDPGEQCDDGNTQDGDGCEASCAPTPAAAICGNGVIEAGELCDDGNDATGDGCALCQLEASPGPEPNQPGPSLDDRVIEEEGCGCRSAPNAADSATWWFLGLALGVGLLRRRRAS